MRKVLLVIFTLGLGLYASSSSAQIFNVEVTDYDGADAFPALKTFVDNEIQKVEDEVNADLPSTPPDRLMEGMANSSVMAGKGIGTDYASNMKVFLVGAGVGAGADLEKDKTSDSDASGVGVAPGLVIGTNLGFMDTQKILGMDTDRLNIYFNFMSYGLEKQINDDPGKEQNINLAMLAYGTHMRYDWIKGAGNKLLGWGGVKFHFGYEYNHTATKFRANVTEKIDETDSNGNRIQGTLTGKPNANIVSTTHSIPLALSTDIQILYFLSLYTGVGVDANFGSASGKGKLNADETDISCTNSAGGQNCSTQRDIKIQASADIDAQGKVTPFTSRAFAGVQLNLPFIRVFTQVDKQFGSELIGATAGVRIVY
jgi:hypothetical protein